MLHSFKALFLIVCLILLLSLMSIILNVFLILQIPFQRELVSRISFMLNKNLVHLLDNIFWTKGFKPETETRAKKVVRKKYDELHILNLLFLNISTISLVLIIS